MSEEIIGGESTAVETPIESPSEPVEGELEQPIEGEASSEPDGEQPLENEPDGEPAPVGEAAIAAKVKSHIEALKKTDPQLAKEIKNLYFAAQAMKTEIPGGLQEVRKLKEVVDEIGGTEGVERIKTERSEWAAIDEKFAAGDASVLKTFRDQNPEGYAKLVPAALDDLASVNRDAYNRALAGPYLATLDSWRFSDLDIIAETLASVVDDKGNALLAREARFLQQLGGQYKTVKDLATKEPPKPQVDPEKVKIQEERAQVAKERQQIAADFVGNATQTHAVKQYDAYLPVEARKMGLDLERMKAAGSYERFQREIDGEVGRMISTDKDAVAKINASIAAGRRDEAVKLSNAKFDGIYQKAIQKVVKEWATLMNPKGVTGKKAPTPPGTGTPTPAGVKKLSAAPNSDLVDKTDPNWQSDYMWGKAKLKTGQRVQW